MQRTDSLEKTLMLGRIEGGRRTGWQRMRGLDGITVSTDMSLSKLWELVDGQGSLACCSPRSATQLDTTQWLNWTDLMPAHPFSSVLRRSAGVGIGYPLQYSWALLVAPLVKNQPAMWDTWVPFLSWEDPLEKGMATHCSILAWRIPWTV